MASSVLDKLRTILGPDHVLTGIDLSPYVVDGRTPEAAVFPGTVDQVRAVMSLATQDGIPVTPWGGGTAIGVGVPSHRIGFVLGLGRLDRILEHEPADLTLVVEAGARLAAVNAALAEHGQMLALDPPGDPTLGACLAATLSGPRRHRYGTMRDLVIGVTVVLPDGTIASSGGKVVKNVAGYDLGKLFCGSRGRLGLVVRLALRLHPLPAVSRTLVADGERWPALRDSPLVPGAVDLVDGERLHVLLEGSERAAEAQVAWARERLAAEEVEAASWQEIRALQARLGEPLRWQGEQAPLVRPGPGVAYAAQRPEPSWSELAERVRAAFDPEGKCSPS